MEGIGIISEIDALASSFLNNCWIIDNDTFNLIEMGWTFSYNKRKTILGLCAVGKKQISLSSYLINHNHDLEIWKETILHEIAHAIDFETRGKTDHGIPWQNISKTIGCDPRAYCDHTELKIPTGKYTLRCKKCGTESNRNRIAKKKVACSLCCTLHNNGMFSDKYTLSYKKNY